MPQSSDQQECSATESDGSQTCTDVYIQQHFLQLCYRHAWQIWGHYSTDALESSWHIWQEVEGRYTYTSANNDLKGVISYNNAVSVHHSCHMSQVLTRWQFVEGLYTLATAIVDYRGWRMVAQSMIPGIFNPATLVYSSSDFEKDTEFSRLLTESAALLHIPPHQITDKSGRTVTISCSAPTKVPVTLVMMNWHVWQGIIGTDGRHYIIDLCRVTPQDANYKGAKNVMAILRPELMLILNEANLTDEASTNNNNDDEDDMQDNDTAINNKSDAKDRGLSFINVLTWHDWRE